MVQRYFWLVQTLLVTFVAALGADIVTSYISTKLAQPVAPTPKPTQTRQVLKHQAGAAFANYQVIVTRNIFNANPPRKEPPPKPPPVVPQVLQPTPLRLGLVGTVTRADSPRYAIIEDLSKRRSQDVYQVGDVIQKALIVEIRRDCVVLDQHGLHESLCFARDTEETQMDQREHSRRKLRFRPTR